MKGYKGFNEGMTCQGFQFKVGEEHKIEGEIELCKRGFHFCKNPIDVMDYYNICESEFAEVEATGKTIEDKDGKDSKVVTSNLKINAKLSLGGFVKCAVDFLLETCKKGASVSSGDSSKLAASGDSSKLAASGYSSQLAASGYSSQLAASGDSSIAAGIGVNNIAKAKKGSWIVLAEWVYNESKKRWIPEEVKAAKIDGKKLKEDTYYKLEKGKFVEAEA